MPISPEKQKLYPGGSINSKEWKAIRARIQARAGDKCEWCGVPNRTHIERYPDGGFLILCSGKGGVRIICTTAHLNHNPSDNRDENLAFLCQRCHLQYDADHHKENANKTRRAKMAIGDLFSVDGKEQDNGNKLLSEN